MMNEAEASWARATATWLRTLIKLGANEDNVRGVLLGAFVRRCSAAGLSRAEAHGVLDLVWDDYERRMREEGS